MYVSVTLSEHGRESIEYVQGNGTGHNGHKERNLYESRINLLPGVSVADQMAKGWSQARVNHRKQLVILIISWSKNELNPDNPYDVLVANEIATNLVKKKYPDREAYIGIQADGKSEMLHAHVLISDTRLNDFKGTTNKQRHVAHIRQWANEEASSFIELDRGKTTGIKITKTERAKADKAAEIRKNNVGKSEDEIRDILITEKAYSYKEDMRNRILMAAQKSASEDEFFAELERSGINATRKNSKTHGEYYLYDFTAGCPINTRNKKARSYKFGYSFSPEGIATIIASNNRGKKDKTDRKIQESKEFVKWLADNNLSYMQFDQNGHISSIDFNRMDELHELYEKSLNDEKDAMKNSTAKDIDVTEVNLIELPVLNNNKHSEKKPGLESHRAKMEQLVGQERKYNYKVQGAAELFLAQQRAALADDDIIIDYSDTKDFSYRK